MPKLITIVIPAHNEEKNISEIYREIVGIFKEKLPNYSREIIFVDDGSTDKTLDEIKKLTKTDVSVKYIEFSRNFGKEAATTAGIHIAHSEAVIIIDCDLQHPPEYIPEFVEKWENGAEMVVGIRQKDEHDGLVKAAGSKMFYKIMHAIGETPIAPHSTDFRLIDRKVIKEFNKLTEHNRMTRGLFAWLGFKRDFVYFIPRKRMNNKPSYNKIKLTRLALSSFVGHSFFPLKLAGYLGMFIVFISLIFGIFMIVDKIFNDPWGMHFSGPAMLAVLLLFLIGIVLSCLGLIALYIGAIKSEVTNRPLYVIRDSNLNKEKEV